MFTIECFHAQLIPGYVLGMVQPSLAASLRCSGIANTDESIGRLARILAPHIPPDRLAEAQAARGAGGWGRLAAAIGASVAGLQESAGIPVIGSAQISAEAPQGRALSSRSADSLQLIMPSLEPRAAKPALDWVLKTLDSLNLDPAQDGLSARQQAELEALMEGLRSAAPVGTNNIRFIRAAHALGIPVLRLPGGVFQYGWGHRARWFNSSVTDETSAIGVAQSKDKSLTSATLRMAGLPVPEGRLVKDLADAVALAEKLGGPVVVKPANLDQGMGVFADLRNTDEVREAYEQARKLSPKILVERHIPGTPFRITVFRGESVATVRRLPAGVTGDGVATVEALVERANADPRRSSSRFSIMKPILIDDEARMMLVREGLDLAAVPRAGQFVALRRAANVSTGGDAIVLGPDQVHPSYARLAERATALLRLDVAAVDFLTPDIRGPWLEVGATLIEVNAQPQMGTVLTHLHGKLLGSYVRGDGRIPSMLVLGADRANLIREIRERCFADIPGLGSAAADGAFIGNRQITAGPGEGPAATLALLIDPSVTALLLAVEPAELLRKGLPLPFFDHLLLGDWTVQWIQWPTLARALALMRDHLRGQVWLAQGHPLRHHAEKIFGDNRLRAFPSRPSMLDAIRRMLNEQSP